MSVIADLRVPADAFDLGRVLDVRGEATVSVETMVPMGDRAIPLIWVTDHARRAFESAVRDHEAVESLREIEIHDDRVLYAVEWSTEGDGLFERFLATNAYLLAAAATSDAWRFEVRFPDHESLATFRRECDEANISIQINRIYNPTRPDSGPHYGLTEPQREALVRAVREGYYAIPRRISTKELAATLDISDQATTERLRRAIITLVEHTLLAVDEETEH